VRARSVGSGHKGRATRPGLFLIVDTPRGPFRLCLADRPPGKQGVKA
jgi:hypothetical protein